MSNSTLRLTTRNTAQVNITPQNCFSSFFNRIRRVCGCAKKEESLPLVHAVDSVRLVYMRRIEEASLLNIRRQQGPNFTRINEETQTRIVRKRRTRQELSTIQALEKALKEYESKNKTIISSTRVPESISFDKTQQISRTSQTDPAQVIDSPLLKPMNDIPVRNSMTSDEIKNIILCNGSTEDLNIAVKNENSNSDLKEKFPEDVLKDVLERPSKSTIQTV